MRFLLDTNTIIALYNNSNSKLRAHITSHQPADIAISSLVAHELYYGAYKSQRVEQNLAKVDYLPFEVIAFDKEDAQQAGEIRAELAKSGTPIGPYDVLIAGQALARNLTLVTHNTKEFNRITNLMLEDWLI
ncbi:MAG: type II toxin-antitoxin system VapC family toxin [Methylophilus sp.]|jgi:tRNA(fMet)-specific endonuclease VapC